MSLAHFYAKNYLLLSHKQFDLKKLEQWFSTIRFGPKMKQKMASQGIRNIKIVFYSIFWRTNNNYEEFLKLMKLWFSLFFTKLQYGLHSTRRGLLKE